jgi:hypothetical protein
VFAVSAEDASVAPADFKTASFWFCKRTVETSAISNATSIAFNDFDMLESLSVLAKMMVNALGQSRRVSGVELDHDVSTYH